MTTREAFVQIPTGLLTGGRLILSGVITLVWMLATDPLGAQTTPREFPITTSSPAAREEFKWGLREIREGMRSRAWVRLDRALALDSTIAVARVLRARASSGVSAEWRRAELDRGVREAAGATVEELLFAVAWREWTIGRREAGNAAWAALIDLLPQDPMIVQERPTLLLANGKRAEAVVAAKELVARFPGSPELHSVLAYTVLAAQGDTTAALRALEEYAERAPDSPHAHSRLARSAASWGHWQYAPEHYQRSVELDSTFVYGHFGLADVALGSGDVPAAQRFLDAAIRHEASEAERIRFARYRAHLFVLRDLPLETIPSLRALAAQEMHSGRPRVAASILMEAAGIDGALGKGTEVDSLLAEARRSPDLDLLSFHAWAGSAYAFSGRTKDADRSADSLVLAARAMQSTYMEGPVASMVRGMARSSAGEYTRALEYFAQSDTQFPLVQISQARALDALGRRDEAEQAYARVRAATRYQSYGAADVIARALEASLRRTR